MVGDEGGLLDAAVRLSVRRNRSRELEVARR